MLKLFMFSSVGIHTQKSRLTFQYAETKQYTHIMNRDNRVEKERIGKKKWIMNCGKPTSKLCNV